MRGNHVDLGRQDYAPPAPLNEGDLASVSGLEMRPVEGKKRPTFEVYKDGALIGYVRKTMGGPEFKMAGPDGFWHFTEETQDTLPGEDPFARTLLMLNGWHEKRQTTTNKTEASNMPLGFKEKRELQRIVSDKQAAIETGGLGFKDKREAQKALQDALEKLGAAIDAGKGEGNTKLADLIAGKFNDLAPLAFLKVLEEVVRELNGDIEPVKPPVISYIEANAGSIMESAEAMAAFQGILESAGQPQAPGVAVRMPEGMMDGIPPREIVVDIDVPFEEPAVFRPIVQSIESARAGDKITVNLNTPGGRTDAAQALYVALLNTPAKTKARIINAASSGSIVAMACDEIEATPFCTMMIHNASGGVGGKVGDMMAATAYRDGYFREWFGQLYAGFLAPSEIQDVMKGQDIWLKDSEIKARLDNWKPIRERVKADGTIQPA